MDLRHVDLNLISVLDALFEARSVSGAARRLKVTQPTVSFALGKLRHFFGDDLFVRQARAMSPTPFALSLRQPVQEILAIIHRDVLPKAPFDPATTTREFTICTSDVGELCFLPRLVQAFAAEAPHACLRSISMPAEEDLSAHLARAADVALGYFPRLDAPDLIVEHLFDHPFVCIARQGHPAFDEPITLEAFLQCEHAVVHPQGRSQHIVQQSLSTMGLEVKVSVHTAHFASLPFLLLGSDLISLVPASIADAFVEYMPLETTAAPLQIPAIPLSQHWSRRNATDPALKWLLELIARLFQEPEGRKPSSLTAQRR